MKHRTLLSIAALSPSVAVISMQEMAASLVVALLGITGAISFVIAMVACSPKLNQSAVFSNAPKTTEYPSLLVKSAFASLKDRSPDPALIRASLQMLLSPSPANSAFVTQDLQVGMVLSQIVARWGLSDALSLTEDQARELWLIERLMRTTPSEAGALASYFAAPTAMLAMRDRVANNSFV